MSNYYYFAAQLPLLMFEMKAEVSKESFVDEAAKWLSAVDYKILKQVNIDNYMESEVTSLVQKTYAKFEHAIRSEVVEVRKETGNTAGTMLAPTIKSIVNEGTPLDIEKSLLFLRWEFIEEQEEGHYFDRIFLELYFLKIQILERLREFNKEEGSKVFTTLCEVHFG